MFMKTLMMSFLASTALIPSLFAAPAVKPMEISRCEVYVGDGADKTQDCQKVAAEVCSNKNICELPIGRNLTGGKMLADWAKVIVEYRCGSATRINGPHHQNDHATMTLTCGGRG